MDNYNILFVTIQLTVTICASFSAITIMRTGYLSLKALLIVVYSFCMSTLIAIAAIVVIDVIIFLLRM